MVRQRQQLTRLNWSSQKKDWLASLFAYLRLDQQTKNDQSKEVKIPASQDLTPTEISAIERSPFVFLTFIPGLTNQLKRVLNKAGCKTYSKAGTRLSMCKEQDSSIPTKKESTKSLAPAHPLPSTLAKLHANSQHVQRKIRSRWRTDIGVIPGLQLTKRHALQPLTRKILIFSPPCPTKKPY